MEKCRTKDIHVPSKATPCFLIQKKSVHIFGKFIENCQFYDKIHT